MTVRLIFLFLCFQTGLLAQPSNDDCENAIDLGIAPYCESTVFSNEGATASMIVPNSIPPCWDAGTVQRDVWFVFTASDTILDYSITITGVSDMGSNPLTNPQVAVYRGECTPNNLFFFGCFSPAISGSNSLKFSLSGLTPGAQYWLRISDFPEADPDNAGTFNLCIEKKSPLTNIIEGFSKDCEGQLVDSGGPDGNYGSNESYTFTICPEIPSACIELSFLYYHLDFEEEEINIYDGPDDNGPLLGTITSTFVLSDTLMDEWGGVCKTYRATSGCMTITFTSGAFNEYEGFLAEWKCSPVPCQTLSQPVLQSSFTEGDVLQNLSSTQTIVTFDKITCAQGASGLFFSGDQTDLGLNKGILLTTGSAVIAQGPNNLGSAGFSNGTPGDSDLDILSFLNGTALESFDACILELDVYANTNEITFEYVFGSEEYHEYAGTNFNDIFAFLISGPGIAGVPQIGNQANMAVLPDGSPVEINNVNYQNNWEYYRDNSGGTSLQYDGLTSDYLSKKKSLTARYAVEPCQTYHLKLAIADRGDSSFDSGVFISEIKGGAPSITVDFKNGIDYLVEDCTNSPDEVFFTLNSPLDQPLSYNVTLGGSATPGVDYQLDIPPLITFQPGETSLSFPIVPLTDGIAEGEESITITLSNDFGCGNVIFAVYTILIRDDLSISVNGGQDTVFYCPGTSVTLEAEGANSYFWEPSGIFSAPGSANTVATPPMDMYVVVTGQLGVCTAVDSVYLFQVNPQIDIANPNPTTMCQGRPVTLMANNNLAGQGSIAWQPTFGLSNPNAAETQANPTFSTTYIVTASLTGCSVSDTITLQVLPFDFPTVIPDVSVCEGSSIPLANDLFTFSTTYQWSPGIWLSDSTVSGPIATPESTITYKLLAESEGGVCRDSAEVTLTVIPASLSIAPQDTAFLCYGDTIGLNANFTQGGTLTWLPADSTKLLPFSNSAQVFGPQSFWAYAEMTVGPCKRVDSVFVRVDSLPELAITKFADRPFYCEGEIITFLSPSYLNTDFPDIRHLWTPNNNAFLSPDSNLNLILTALETATYIRQTRNNACSSDDTVMIQVIPIGINLSVEQQTLCEGDTAQVFILDDNIEDIEWTPTNGLSCSTCTDPIITAIQTQVYQVKGSEQGCAKQGAVLVNVPIPVLDLPEFLLLCEGSPGNLNPNASPQTSYFWTSTDPSFGTSNEANPAVPGLVDAVYYVTATMNGCTRTGELPVTIVRPPDLSLMTSDSMICSGESVILTAEGAPVGGSYLWTPGGATSPEISVTPPVSTIYEVVYTTVANCFSESASITISVEQPLDITISVEPEQDTFILGVPVTFTAKTSPPAAPGSTFRWFINGEEVSGASQSTLETIAQEPPFEVRVEITSPAGCVSEQEEDWVVKIPSFQIPNLFTPNGDNTNDHFKVILDPGLTLTEFRVYSRWGQLVFDDPSEADGWDGRWKGEDQPSDVYGFVVTVRYGDGRTVTERGEVTLLR